MMDEWSARQRADFRKRMRAVKFIISDFDGCIIPYHTQVDQECVEKVKKLLAERGSKFQFAIVTGGRAERVGVFADETSVLLLAEMGGVLYDPSTKPKPITVLASKEQVSFIMNVVAAKLERFLGDRFQGYGRHDKYTMLTYQKPEGTKMEGFRAAVLGYLRNRMPDEMKKLYISYTENLIEINFKGFDKSRAVDFLIDKYRIPGKNIAYFGDADNDIPAFERVLRLGGIVIAPKNSDKEVKAFISKNRNSRVFAHYLESTYCMFDILTAIQDG